MKLFSNVDGEPAWIAVGTLPVGVVAIGVMPLGILAIASGFGRGVVVVSCGLSVGLVTATCGMSAGLYSVGVGLNVALKGAGMVLTAFGGGNAKYSLLRKTVIPAIILGAFAYVGAPIISAMRVVTSNHEVMVTWNGTARSTEGIYVKPGTPCTVQATFRGDGRAVLQSHVAVACGHLKLFESGPIKSGSVVVMGTDDLACDVKQDAADGGFTYSANCRASEFQGSASRGTGAFGARPSLQLDTGAGQAVLELDGARPLHIELAVDAHSALVGGSGLFTRD
jgi:hypothetical protein